MLDQVALPLELEEDRRSKLGVLRVVRAPTTSTWIVTSARRLRVENGGQICKTCEQSAAPSKRGQEGQERARHHGTVPRGGMRSMQCVRFKAHKGRPARRLAAARFAEGTRAIFKGCTLVITWTRPQVDFPRGTKEGETNARCGARLGGADCNVFA